MKIRFIFLNWRENRLQNPSKTLLNKLLLHCLFSICIIILFCTALNLSSTASEINSFAVYYFDNLTGKDDWDWLERGLPDMLSHTFSQSEKIDFVSLEEIEKLPEIDLYQRLTVGRDLNLFGSLSDLLKTDLLFTGYFTLEQRDILKFNLVMYQSKSDQLFEFREMTIIPEDLFYLKEHIAQTILQETNLYIDEDLALNLKKNISTSLVALRYYYLSLELKNQATTEYQGIDFPSKPLWSKAIEYGEKAVAEDPHFAEAYYLLSQIYEKTKWTAREIVSLENFIEVAQNNSNIKISYRRLSEAFYRLAYSNYEQGKTASTIQNLTDSVFYQPNNIKARILLMRIYYESGQTDKALEQGEEIKKIEPDRDIDWVVSQYQQAEIYGREAYELYVTGYNAYSNKKWPEAIEFFKLAINLSKDFKGANYFLGLSYYHAGDLNNSIKYLEATVRLDPFDNNARIYLNKAMEEKEFGREAVWIFNQGYKYYTEGEYQDALLKFKESVQINPNFEKTRIYLMRTYYHLNQMEEYLAERERIGGDQAFDVDWEKEYYQLAYNFYSLGEYAKALEKLREVLAINPDFLEARFLMAETAYELGDYGEANQHYQYIIDNYGESQYYENSLLGNGWTAYLLGNYQQAEIDLELLIKNFPRSTLYLEGVYKLGRIYFAQKKYSQTINLYENLSTVDPLKFDKFEIEYILGQSYFWEGLYDKAKGYFTDIMNNNPSFELINETKYHYSFTLFKEGKYQEAMVILEELAKKESQVKVEAQYLLARVLLEQKDYDRVIDIDSSLAEQNIDGSILEKVLFDLGLAYARKGQDQEASTYFERVVRQFPAGELSTIATQELAQSYYQLTQYQDVLNILENINSQEAIELKIEAARKINNEEKLLSLYQDLTEQTADDAMVREGYFSLAKDKYEKGAYQEAADLFKKVENTVNTDKMRQEINYWQGLCYYRLADYFQAEEYFHSINYFAGDEVAIRALYMLGETYYKQDKYSEAIHYYQEFLKYYSSHSLAAHVQYSVSWSYLNLRDYPLALESFGRLVQDYSESQFSEEGNYLLGKIQFLVKNYNEARAKIQDFVKNHPMSQFAEEGIYILAQIDLEEQEWFDSIINFEKLLDRFPDSKYIPNSLYGLCLSYFKKGEYEKAVQVGDRYLKDIPTGVLVCDILYITALCQEELGNELQANQKYEMIIKNCPESSYADFARKKSE
ncbi:MAG TPA: tetratricopeptide repeat protein [Atribacterota bacterium]|nr:tetratricopeptide repeat protein [Atribacterota bacterium]